MRNRYQRRWGKSKGKFEIVAGRELAVRLPLPLVEVWEELQAEVERLSGEAGLQILGAILEDEVTRRVGPRHRPGSSGNLCVNAGPLRERVKAPAILHGLGHID